MREILFRGKSKRTGEWIYGDYVRIKDGENPIEHYIYGKAVIDPETVGQFTGLTDKNGTHIYEGDILKMRGGCNQMDISEYDIICKVTYGFTGYGSEIGFSGSYKSGMHIPLMGMGALTVIGNIYDNPELLK